MSLRRDLNMYFESSVLGIRNNDGTVAPFYVHGVNGRDSSTDLSSFTFYGRKVTNSQGDTLDVEVPYDEVVFELPKLGYIKFSNNSSPVWLCYKQRKTVKKGIITQRVEGLRDSMWTTRGFWKMFNPDFNGRINPDLCLHDDEVLYKGKKVGDKSGDTVTLVNQDCSYLSARIEGGLGCQVLIAQE